MPRSPLSSFDRQLLLAQCLCAVVAFAVNIYALQFGLRESQTWYVLPPEASVRRVEVIRRCLRRGAALHCLRCGSLDIQLIDAFETARPSKCSARWDLGLRRSISSSGPERL